MSDYENNDFNEQNNVNNDVEKKQENNYGTVDNNYVNTEYKDQPSQTYHSYSQPSSNDSHTNYNYQQTSQLYYYPQNQKTKKESKPAKLSTVIIICVIAVLLCGCAGFLGVKLANKNVPVTEATQDSPLIIYRNSESTTTASSSDGSSLTYADVASLVKDSVVEINTEYVSKSSWFQYLDGGAGSGVILTEDGTIITNAHVVMKEDSSGIAETITVRLNNGEEYKATCKGYDTEADIAILKIEAEGLTPVKCGDSDNLVVGEEVVVVGNPLGSLGGSVTNGIISATEREIEVNGTKMKLLQTNAAVNPGNSGGGMFNMNGELVGIVNAKSSGTSIEGLGFAIPVNDSLTVIEQLIEYGYVRGKVKLGITFTTISSNNFYYYYNITPGIYVNELEEGCNDDVLKVGDRIIAVEGNEVTSLDDIKAVIQTKSVGDTIKFQLYRDGKLLEAEVTCYEQVPDLNTDDNNTNNDKDVDFYGNQGEYGDNYWYDQGDMEDFFRDFFR